MMPRGILQGMRVVEVSAFVAAPSGGMTLAQMGAEVIRIDNIGGGLDYHRWPVTEQNDSLFFRGLNKGKRSIAIDIRSPRGQELASEIIRAPGDESGMLLTNFPARGWLSYEKLSAQRSDLIQLTIQGDRQGNSAVDYTVNPAVGIPYVTGPEGEDRPVNHVLPAWDCITGQTAAVGLLSAERYRRATGKGQHIKLALADVALATMESLGFIAEAQLGVTRERAGNYLYGAFGRDFVTADGIRVMVVGLTAKQWKALCQATGLQGEMQRLAARLHLDLNQEGNRYRARKDIAELLEAWFARQNYADVAILFDKDGVCWSRYQSVSDMVANDPECSEQNPLFTRVSQQGVGALLAAGTPLDFMALQRVPAKPAPRLGEHTDQVLSELLGLTSSEIGKLHDAGIVAGVDQ